MAKFALDRNTNPFHPPGIIQECQHLDERVEVLPRLCHHLDELVGVFPRVVQAQRGQMIRGATVTGATTAIEENRTSVENHLAFLNNSALRDVPVSSNLNC